MNQGVIIGVIAFILWGSVSSWWYVCKIKGLCEDTEAVEAVVAEVPEISSEPDETLTEADTIAEEKAAEVAAPTPVSLNFDGILFSKNSTEPANPDMLNSISSIIRDTLQTQSGSMVITGHTCDLGKEVYNETLGLERAKNIGLLLEAGGLTIPYTITSAGESPSAEWQCK